MLSNQYIAGIIDGEGSIGTTRTGKNGNLVGRITVANTDSRLLHALNSTYKGCVSIRNKGSKEGWKPFGSICWSNRQAQEILENVLPFLLLKKEQALLCLELIKMRDLSKSERLDYVKSPTDFFPRRVIGKLKPEIKDKESLIALSLNKLNKKGIIN